MNVRLFSLLMITLTCFTWTSCEDGPSTDKPTADLKSIELTDAELVVSKQNSQFAWDMFSHTTAMDGNTIVSPLSASFALCMTADGANGDTRDEIYRALGFENCNSNDINGYMQKLSSQLMSLDSKTTMAIANSLWYNKNYAIYDSYISNLKTYYNADVLSFDVDKAVNQINAWCSKNTKSYINDLLNPGDVSDLTVSVLVNALYFDGAWKDKFDKKDTFKGTFNSFDNNTSTVDFMSGEKKIGHIAAKSFTMASFDFGNGAYATQFILPNEGKTFNDCIAEIKELGWEYFTKYSTIIDLNVNIPKFTLKNRIDMTPIYQQMGIESAFENNADFSNMTTSNINLSSAYQSNYFEIDEEGAKAASASNTSGDLASIGIPPFTLNRPFIFALTERSTGAILFIGKIEKL